MPLKIYYLDDEPDLNEMFVDLFTGTDREIFTFNDPILAIEVLRLSPPDVLFIDYRLPGITGDQIALQLNPSYPVILITGDLQVECAFKFQAVFGKPYPFAEIEALLEKYGRLSTASSGDRSKLRSY